MSADTPPTPMSDEELQARFSKARDLVRQAEQNLAAAQEEFFALHPHVLNAAGRGQLNQNLWSCERALDRRPHHFSQAGQDAFLDERVFRGKTGGTFVEVGGYDGVTGSNCLFFELMRGWSGLIIEPAPSFHALCAQRRRVACLRLAVGAEAGTAEFLEITEGMKQMGGLLDSYNPELRAKVEADPRHQGQVIEVEVRPLSAILTEHGLTEIDYISLDVEGAEMDVLSTFPFEEIKVAAWTVENNTHTRDIPDFMETKGYRRIEALGVDDIYLRNAAF
ncbi:MAG: FkbM family methyltransferase [Pseudomonadota bacterium]